MKNLNKFLIVFFSVVLIASVAFPQSDASLKKDQTKTERIPDRSYNSSQGLNFTDKVLQNEEFNEKQLKQLEELGISEKDMKTEDGKAKAYKILKAQSVSGTYKTTPKIKAFSSKPIKNTDESVTVTIGTETNVTGTTAGSDITPFGTYWHDGQNQYLFTASELAIAGIGPGDITEIGWEVVLADPALMNGFNIEMKHTTATTVTGFETGFTNVYSGTHTAVVGWNMFTFSSPFAYNGTSNLLVKVCYDNTAYTLNSTVYYSNTLEPMNAWSYNDLTSGCSDAYEGNTISRPNTRITGEEMLNPPPGFPFNPIPVSGSFNVPVDGDLTWSFGNNTLNYDLWLGLTGNMQLVVDNGSVTGPDGVYSYSGLNYSSGYEWQVVAINANGTTSGPVWSFVSQCAVVTAPFLEEFATWPPVCWDLTGGTYSWAHYTTGVECAYANFWGQTSGNTDIMTTPPIDISGGNFGLEFYWSHLYSSSYPTDALEVLVSDDYGTNWTQVWYKAGVDFESNDGAGTTTPGTFVTSEIIPLSSFGSPILVKFYGYSGFGPDAYIDDVNVFEVAYGNLTGTVTKLSDNTPVEGAVISVGPLLNATTGVDGTYTISGILVGDYTATCTATGYNPASADITILADQTTTQDFAITAPTMDIDPLAINVVLDPFQTSTEMVNIANNGNGELNWNASLELLTDDGDAKAPWDLQLSFDVTTASGAAGNAGAECDGQYYYTTRWASNLIHKYDLTGALVEEFSIPGVSGLRDLAFDGTYMYGGATANTIYQMDFVTKTLVSTIASPQPVRSIAYDEGQNGLWVANWATDLVLIDMSGATLATIPASVHMLVGIYGTAYDNWSSGGPYLWIFDQGAGAGSPQILYQADLNTMTMTGFTHDVTADLPPIPDAIAGGLFTIPGLYPGTVSLGGLMQGTPDYFFMYELAPFATWISIAPTSGNIPASNSAQMTVNFDAGEIIPGTIKTANIHFTSNPEVGMITIPVTMIVGSMEFGNITGTITLTGNMPYNMADVTEVLVTAGPYSIYPDASGYFDLPVYPGTYDVTATLYGYTQQSSLGVVVGEGATISGMDFVMPCIYGRIMGTVVDDLSGDPLEGTIIDIEGSGITATTAIDGTYEVFVEAGTYNVTATEETHTPVTEPNVVIPVEGDVTVDFSLQPSLAIVYPSNVDYWTGTTTQTEKTQVSLMNILSAGGEQAWAKFDISMVPAGAVVTSIEFSWYINTTNCPYQHINALPIDPVTADAATLYSAITGGELYTDYSTCPPLGWNTLVLGGNANADLSEAIASGWFAVSFHEYETGGTYAFSADGWNEPNKPYLVINFFIPEFGALNGTVTETATGNPVQGAQITAVGPYYNYYFTTGADGMYSFDPCATGTYTITCNAPGYNVSTATVVVAEDETTTQDFSLTHPQFIVDPMSISIEIEPNAMADEIINMSNPGNGPVNWNANVSILSEDTEVSKDPLLLLCPEESQFSQQSETPEGNWTAGTADDDAGYERFQYFEGLEMSISSITFWGLNLFFDGVGWNSCSEDPMNFIITFYGDNAGAPDVTNVLETSTVSLSAIPTGEILGGLYEIYRYEYNFPSVLAIPSGWVSIQGTEPAGCWFLWMNSPTPGVLSYMDDGTGPVMQDIVMSVCFGGGVSWISIAPNSGTLTPSSNENMTVHFDATDMIPGVYQAEIHFGTNPNVGSPVVNVTMTIAGLIPATNLTLDYSCTDVELTWDMPTGGNADSWNVYKGGVLLGSSTVMEYTDELVMPDVELNYFVKAVYAGEESMPTITKYITVPTPNNLEADGLEAIPNVPSENDVTLNWDAPTACVAPDGYDIYRLGVKINTSLVTSLTYVDPSLPMGIYEYYVVAVYYFGESEPSDAVYTLITGIEDVNSDLFRVYPNPVSGVVNIESSIVMTNVQVINNAGQVVMNKVVNVNQLKIDVSQYEKGVYYIKIETAEGNKLRKITVN